MAFRLSKNRYSHKFSQILATLSLSYMASKLKYCSHLIQKAITLLLSNLTFLALPLWHKLQRNGAAACKRLKVKAKNYGANIRNPYPIALVLAKAAIAGEEEQFLAYKLPFGKTEQCVDFSVTNRDLLALPDQSCRFHSH